MSRIDDEFPYHKAVLSDELINMGHYSNRAMDAEEQSIQLHPHHATRYPGYSIEVAKHLLSSVKTRKSSLYELTLKYFHSSSDIGATCSAEHERQCFCAVPEAMK